MVQVLEEDARDADLPQLLDTRRNLLDAACEPAVRTLVEERGGIRVVAADRLEAADALDRLRAIGPEEAGGHQRETQRGRVAACLLARAVEALLPLAKLHERRAERVHLGRVARREGGEARADRPPEHERRMRELDGTREHGLIAELVRGPGVVEALLGPGADDDLDLLREELEARLRVEEREPVLEVLALVPARAHAHLDTASGDVVDRQGHARENARVAERRGRDQRAEADVLGDRGDRGERRPRVERTGL